MKWLARWFAPKGEARRVGAPSTAAPAAGHRSAIEEAAAARPFSIAAAAAGPPPSTAAASPPGSIAPGGGDTAAGRRDTAGAFLAWLLGCGALPAAPLSPDETRAIAALDALLAARMLPDDLLPRAAALVPQLLAMLRQAELPVAALAQRVAQDPSLAAEVLRLASSAHYRAQGPVDDLGQAIARIGERGVSSCIARVVLKPIYAGPAGALPAPAAVRLWAFAETLAAAAAESAAARGLPPFDGYLSGLLQGSGWLIAWRAFGRAGARLPMPPSTAFAEAAEPRAHALFGRVARRWAITPGLTAFAADAERTPLAATAHPLGVALRDAMPDALRALAGAPAG